MNTETEGRMRFYEERYVSESLVLKGPTAVYLGTKDPRTCRFCGKTAPEVPFKKVAHAFPELIGNKYLLSYRECDSCNNLFSETLEDNFAKFTGLQRTVSRVKGKGGVPSVKTPDKKFRWDVVSGNSRINTEVGHESISIDERANRATITVAKQPYIPRFAFKCLVKMALSVVPDSDIGLFSKTLAWLQMRNPLDDHYEGNECKCVMGVVDGNIGFPNVFYLLFLRKPNVTDVPYASFIVGWGHYTYQVFVPLCAADQNLEGRALSMPTYPHPFELVDTPRKVSRFILDLQSLQIRKEVDSVSYTFDRILKTPGQNPKQSNTDT